MGHFAVDWMNGQRSVLITYLSGPLGLTNAAIGLFTTIYTLAGALTQPIFGHITDRIGPRWVIAGGVIWIGVFYAIALFSPGWTALIFLVIACLGSGAVHPAGVMQATTVTRENMSGREATAAAYFFIFGQVGFFVGPLLAGFLLTRFGEPGLFPTSAIVVMIGLLIFRLLIPGRIKTREAPTQLATPITKNWRNRIIPVAALLLIASFQAAAQQNITTFLPKMLSDAGKPASVYGLISSLYIIGTAGGNLLGGPLGDRFGKKRVIISGLVLASFPLLLMTSLGVSDWLYLLMPIVGLIIELAYPSVFVLAQRIVPGSLGLSSGLIMAFIFAAGTLGTAISGPIADQWGFSMVFLISTGLVFIAGILALGLKEEKFGLSVPISPPSLDPIE